MRNTHIATFACLVTVLVLAPAASAAMLAIRPQPTQYTVAGDLNSGSSGDQFYCTSDTAPATAELTDLGDGDYRIAFAVASPCGPFADRGAGQDDGNGVIRGSGQNGATWEVRNLLYSPTKVGNADAGPASFHLYVTTTYQVAGQAIRVAAAGTLLGAGADPR